MAIFCPDSQLWRYQHWIVVTTLIAALHVTDDLSLHADHFRGRVEWRCSAIRPLNRPKLPSHYPLLKLIAYLTIRSLPHTAIYRCLKDRTFVLNSGAFEDVITRICHRLLRRFFRLHFMARLPCHCNDTIRLMAEPRCKFTVLLQDFFR